jgi:hypothetical protein
LSDIIKGDIGLRAASMHSVRHFPGVSTMPSMQSCTYYLIKYRHSKFKYNFKYDKLWPLKFYHNRVQDVKCFKLELSRFQYPHFVNSSLFRRVSLSVDVCKLIVSDTTRRWLLWSIEFCSLLRAPPSKLGAGVASTLAGVADICLAGVSNFLQIRFRWGNERCSLFIISHSLSL